MERSHLGLFVLSAFFAASYGQKGIYCVDPHTELHYPVNSTWPSSTFCGTYTCNAELVPKNGDDDKFKSIPTLEITLHDKFVNGNDREAEMLPYEMLEEEENEGSGKDLQSEDGDYAKNIENVLRASKELTEISGEIYDISKHIKLYKMANDLLKSINKSEDSNKFSDEDVGKILKSLAKRNYDDENLKDGGLETADTKTVYHNMDQMDYTKNFLPNHYSGSEFMKYPANGVFESSYDYNSPISPYYPYFSNYFYGSPYYRDPFSNNLHRQSDYYFNINPADNDINSSNLKESYLIPDDLGQNLNYFSHRQPSSGVNNLYSDQYIRYWMSKGYRFPSIPKISPIRSSPLSDFTNYNNQYQYNENKLASTTNLYESKNNDAKENLNNDNQFSHYQNFEDLNNFPNEKSVFYNVNKNGHANFHQSSLNESGENHYHKYYLYNFDGQNHKIHDNITNIAYYYYDPVKNEYTMDVPKNYTEYEKYYKKYFEKQPNPALSANGDSILDLDEYYKQYNNELAENDQQEKYDSHQSDTHVREVSKLPRDEVHLREYAPKLENEYQHTNNDLYNSLLNKATEFLESEDSTSKDASDSLEPKVGRAYKYTITDSVNLKSDRNNDLETPKDETQWRHSLPYSHLLNSANKGIKDFKLRIASESSEEALTRINANSNLLLGTQRSPSILKPVHLLNLNPFVNYKAKRGLGRISKRSVNTGLDETDLRNGGRKWRSYITVQGCPETLEPGYFKSGDSSKHYPHCCPQKITQ